MEKVHDEDETQIDLRELLFALKKRILIIFAAFLGGAAVAAVVRSLGDKRVLGVLVKVLSELHNAVCGILTSPSVSASIR